MPNLTPFNNPFLVGFDELEQMLLRVAKGADSFPPYNVEQLDAATFQITMAVAGYSEEDLDILQEDNQLVIRGRQEHDPNRHYLHQGIAARSFLKSFVLADGMKIDNAVLENGLLIITLQKPQKNPNIKKIAITKKSKTVHLNRKGGQNG
ncbi:MAG: Hsp20 family protein [Alphaproteobacteria bacterium]|nr:Hsp20 family protein [Alphaproteobacteria bacterium]